MKTIRYIFKKQFILLMILSVFCLKGQAQVEDNLHFNVDWQMNAPISTDFADKISGWGMNFEAGYCDAALVVGSIPEFPYQS